MKSFKNKKTTAYVILLGSIILAGFFVLTTYAETSISDGLTDNSEDKETAEKIEELEKRAKIFREIIAIKQKQQQSLSTQLDVMDTQINVVQTEIDKNKKQIELLNKQIIDLQRQVEEKENAITNQKALLADLLQSYYTLSQQNPLQTFLESKNVGAFMVKKDRLTQMGDKIKEMVESLESLKGNLEKQIKDLENKKNDIMKLHLDLQDKNAYLANTKAQKENLLEQTQGEEARYAQLLARVEEQKQQLLNIDELYNTSGLSVDSFPKPSDSAKASLTWFYSQRDPKWSEMRIGNSNSLMKSYGCAVAAIAMVFTQHGETVTPKTLVQKPIFSWDLIAWPKTWSEPNVTMASYGSGHGNISWSVIDEQIKKGNPVIVYLKRTAGGGHYVVVHSKDKNGKYVVHDPYFGPNIYLDTSKALVGAMGGQSSIVMDQMIIYN